MKPEDVPAEWVEKAARAMADDHHLLWVYDDPQPFDPDWVIEKRETWEHHARHALAAVLPDIQAQAWDEGQASGLREGNLMRAYGEARPGLNPYRAAHYREGKS